MHGTQVLLIPAEGAQLASDRDAMDLIADTFGQDADMIVVPTARLSAEFFQLSSGVAGAVMQKFVNYGRHVVILGDVSEHVERSKSFAGLVYESNRGKHVWFLADLEELDSRLKERVS